MTRVSLFLDHNDRDEDADNNGHPRGEENTELTDVGVGHGYLLLRRRAPRLETTRARMDVKRAAKTALKTPAQRAMLMSGLLPRENDRAKDGDKDEDGGDFKRE
jgi:hypothetical protein